MVKEQIIHQTTNYQSYKQLTRQSVNVTPKV